MALGPIRRSRPSVCPCRRPIGSAPGAADGIEIRGASEIEPVQPIDFLVDHAARGLRITADGRKEPQWAERRRRLLRDLALLQGDQLETAAAEIADDAPGPRGAPQDARGRKPRLLFAALDSDRQSEHPVQGLREVSAVGCVADRRRRQKLETLDSHGLRQGDKSFETRDRLLHALVMKHSRDVQVARQRSKVAASAASAFSSVRRTWMSSFALRREAFFRLGLNPASW